MPYSAGNHQVITTANQLGEILRARRKSRGISQQDVAAKVAISQARLSMLERETERLTLGRLIALANLLGLELVIQDKTKPTIPRTEW